jgi:hypothetical protein
MHIPRAFLPDPQLHRRLGQRELELVGLHPQPPLLRSARTPSGPEIFSSRARRPASRNLARQLSTALVLTPCRRAASAAFTSPASTASTTLCFSSTGNRTAGLRISSDLRLRSGDSIAGVCHKS